MVCCLHSIASGLRIVSEGVTKTTLKLQFQVSLPPLTSVVGKMLFLHLLGFQLDILTASHEIMHLFPVLH